MARVKLPRSCLLHGYPGAHLQITEPPQIGAFIGAVYRAVIKRIEEFNREQQTNREQFTNFGGVVERGAPAEILAVQRNS